MKKWKVELDRVDRRFTDVVVEAETQEEAEEIANEKGYFDFDLDWESLSADITVGDAWHVDEEDEEEDEEEDACEE